MILILNSICQNSNFLRFIYYAKVFLRVIFFIVPLGLIFKLTVDVYKNILSGNGDELKKSYRTMINRILAAVILFLIYPIINIIFGLDIFNNVNYLDCWNNATTINEIDSYNKSIILDVNPSEIEGNTTLECFGTVGCEFKLPIAKRNNFDFLGWSTTNDCKSIVNNEYYTTTKKVELYPCFQIIEKPYEDINKNNQIKTDYTIFVGDSRTADMCSYLKKSMLSTETCVAAVGKSLNWFNSTAVLKVNNILNSNSDKTYNIVIDLGVNGLSPSNGSKYASTYNNLKNETWSKHNVIVSSVTPVNETKYSRKYKTKKFNSKIVSFNNNLKSNLSNNIVYCDIYNSVLSFINNSKMVEPDGLHYTKSGSEKIYKLKKNCIS